MKKKMIIIVTAAALVVGLIVAVVLNRRKTGQPVYDQVIASETKYLLSLQLEDGALAEYGVQDDNTAYIMPYFNDFAALGLLDGGTDNADYVKKYMDWYFAHMNTAEQDVSGLAGTVYDYNVTLDSSGHILTEKPHEEVGVGKYYDSTDSYAAMFLAVVDQYAAVTGDRQYVADHQSQIDTLVDVIFGTLDNGLTYATPAYKIKYVMDNSEVYYGLGMALDLYANYGTDAGGRCERITALMASIRDKVVNEYYTEMGYGHFWYYFDEHDMHGAYYWTHFYPDATSQVFPAMFGVIAPTDEKAVHCYDMFNKYWSTGKAKHTWEKMDTTDEYAWSDLCYAAVVMGDTQRAETFMTTYLAKYGAKHQYPAYVGDSGKLLRAAYLLKKTVEKG